MYVYILLDCGSDLTLDLLENPHEHLMPDEGSLSQAVWIDLYAVTAGITRVMVERHFPQVLSDSRGVLWTSLNDL